MSSAKRNFSVEIRKFGGWQELVGPGFVLYWAGQLGNVAELLSVLREESCDETILRSLIRKVETWTGHFSVVIDSTRFAIAFVDRIRSYPIVYLNSVNSFQISSSPYYFKDVEELKIDDEACLELSTSNYVTGARTLYRDVKQLQPGEAILLHKGNLLPIRVKYTEYLTRDLANRSEADLIEEQEAAVSAIFSRIVDDAAGREILIPLSAGLDSRLILTKLKAMGYQRLRTFSYGPLGNQDAAGAARIAREVGVPWTFIPYRAREVKEYFWSLERMEYWRYASCGASVPFMVDEVALRQLFSSGQFGDPSEAMIINGQSGDFTSGGHLIGKHLERLDPETSYSLAKVIEGILIKHYALRTCTDLEKRKFTAHILDKIGAVEGTYSGQELAKLYEFWEAEERQAKYVVNGQRSYDFIGLQWRLPLWDRELFNYWRTIPYRFKVGQSLYKSFLRATNYCGMFKDRSFPVENFHGLGRMVFPIARLVGLFGGHEAKNQTYRLAAYFGKYSNHYAPYGFAAHWKDFRRLQSPLGRYAETLLAEIRSYPTLVTN